MQLPSFPGLYPQATWHLTQALCSLNCKVDVPSFIDSKMRLFPPCDLSETEPRLSVVTSKSLSANSYSCRSRVEPSMDTFY